MVRDTTEGKINFLNVRFGPMLRRWAEHLTKGRVKYPDVEPGVPNWTLAEGVAEYLRAKDSAARHFESWLNGELDEDHAAGIYFNVNLAEYVREKAAANGAEIDPALGAGVELTKEAFPRLARLINEARNTPPPPLPDETITKGPEYCGCGAHSKGTPCFFKSQKYG